MAKKRGDSRGIKGLASSVPQWGWWLLAVLIFALVATQAKVEPSILPDHLAAQCRAIDQHGKEQCSTYGVITSLLFLTGEWVGRNHTTVSAVSAAIVAIFTGSLWVSTFTLWRVSHQQLLAANAPKIGAYQIECTVAADSALEGSFFLINEGGTDAALVGAHVKAYYGGRLPQQFPGEDGSRLIHDEPIEAGEAIRWSFTSDLTLSREDIGHIEGGKAHIFLLGIVRFHDQRKVFHRTIFCRRYDTKSMRWEPTNDYDYEIQT